MNEQWWAEAQQEIESMEQTDKRLGVSQLYLSRRELLFGAIRKNAPIEVLQCIWTKAWKENANGINTDLHGVHMLLSCYSIKGFEFLLERGADPRKMIKPSIHPECFPRNASYPVWLMIAFEDCFLASIHPRETLSLECTQKLLLCTKYYLSLSASYQYSWSNAIKTFRNEFQSIWWPGTSSYICALEWFFKHLTTLLVLAHGRRCAKSKLYRIPGELLHKLKDLLYV